MYTIEKVVGIISPNREQLTVNGQNFGSTSDRSMWDWALEWDAHQKELDWQRIYNIARLAQ